jgi:hypothetical protein
LDKFHLAVANNLHGSPVPRRFRLQIGQLIQKGAQERAPSLFSIYNFFFNPSSGGATPRGPQLDDREDPSVKWHVA